VVPSNKIQTILRTWNTGEVDMIGIDEKNLKANWALEINGATDMLKIPGN